MGLKTLYTSTLMVLGVGYIFAMIQVFDSHAGRDGKPGLSVRDLVIAYSGSKSDTRLESALKGPMSSMLPTEQRNEILAWVRRGAKENEFNSGIKTIVEQRCLMCHGGNNPHIPNFSSFKGISQMVQFDTGMDIFTLVRVSHIHLFGITFIFFIVSTIFCHAYIKPLWFKCVVIMVPFFAILCDIGSWYLTKVLPGFAWVVMISGFFMGIAFSIQWFVSIYQMWFYHPSQDLIEKDGIVS